MTGTPQQQTSSGQPAIFAMTLGRPIFPLAPPSVKAEIVDKNNAAPPDSLFVSDTLLELKAKLTPPQPSAKSHYAWSLAPSDVGEIVGGDTKASVKIRLKKKCDELTVTLAFTQGTPSDSAAGPNAPPPMDQVVSQTSCKLEVKEFKLDLKPRAEGEDPPTEIRVRGTLVASTGDVEGAFAWSVVDNASAVDLPTPDSADGELVVVVAKRQPKVKFRCTFTPRDASEGGPVTLAKTVDVLFLAKSVGQDFWKKTLDVTNDRDDVIAVQDRLTQLGYPLDAATAGVISGCDDATARAIRFFQGHSLHTSDHDISMRKHLDGVIDAGGDTEAKLFATNAPRYRAPRDPERTGSPDDAISDGTKAVRDDAMSDPTSPEVAKWERIMEVWGLIFPHTASGVQLQSGYRSYVEQRRLLWAKWNDGRDERGAGHLRDNTAAGIKADSLGRKMKGKDRVRDYFKSTLDQDELRMRQQHGDLDPWTLDKWQHYQDAIASYTNTGYSVQGTPDNAAVAFTELHPDACWNQDEREMANIVKNAHGGEIDPPGKSKHGRARALDIGLSDESLRAALWCAAALPGANGIENPKDGVVIELLIKETDSGCLHIQWVD